MNARSRCQRRRRHRRGAAVVEFAITTPIVFMFFGGIIILAQASLLRDTAQHAAYEGARAVIMPGVDVEMAEAASSAILATVGAQVANIDVQPANLTTSTPEVTVTVALPMGANLWLQAPWLPDSWLVEESITLRREVE